MPAGAPGGAALPPTTVNTIKSLRTWTKWFGIISIVSGGLACLTIVGIMSGWLPILYGYWILKSGESLEAYAQRGDMAALDQGLGHLRNYFLTMTIIVILALASVLLVILMYVILGAFWVGLMALLVGAGAAAGP
jgi:hypothetical protein